jgi:DNA-binding LytR/AlgR family response regulator
MDRSARQAYIAVSNRNVTRKLFFSEILFIEMDYHELLFATQEGKIYMRGSSADLKRYTRQCSDLYECHSYLTINLRHVISMENRMVLFSDGSVRQLGRKSFYRAKNAFAEYIRTAE